MATFVFAISFLLVLMITSESIRRSKHAAVVMFVVYPIIMTLFFLKTKHAFFHYLKMYSLIMGVLWITAHRYTKLGTMKWSNFGLYLILFSNILEAIGQEFTSEKYFNAFAGFLLLITISSPGKISVDQTGKHKDLEWDMPFSWIMGYTIWNWIFVLGNWPYNYYTVHGASRSINLVAAK